jgi:tRNA1(Val) A37 N6-methylase TrmN6
MNTPSTEPHPNSNIQTIHWVENDQTHSMQWHSESGAPAPKRVQIADDTLNADTAYKLACEGVALLWRGDFQNARQLLQAIARRIDHKKLKKSAKKKQDNLTARDTFNLYRLAQSQRARTLAMILIPFEADYHIPLRRSPNVKQACEEAYGAFQAPFIASLRELLGVVGAHEWRKNGVEIAALGKKIYPHYGVFSPVRGEYLKLIANAPFPSTELAFDIGTGTGVIAAILAQRGIQKIIATDFDQRAIDCAQENIKALDIAHQVQLCQTDLFPEGRAPLIVCNPPWIPARPNSPIEYAVYDPESRMVRGFLSQAAAHLTSNGEAWLIMSNLAELLGLRAETDICTWIAEGGLSLIEKHDIQPEHNKAADISDPLHFARAAEVTSLWRLKSNSSQP